MAPAALAVTLRVTETWRWRVALAVVTLAVRATRSGRLADRLLALLVRHGHRLLDFSVEHKQVAS